MTPHNPKNHKQLPRIQFKVAKRAVRYDHLTHKEVLEIINNPESEEYELKEAKRIANQRFNNKKRI